MTARLAEQEQQLRTLLTADHRLDDITRARIWSQLEDAVAEPASPVAPHTWQRPAGIALAALAMAAALVLVVRATRTPSEHGDRLTVATDATLTSRLGPYAHTALVGPAQLELLGPAGDATSVRLDRGTLLAEFTGGPGRSLRIEAGDLVVEIVGTLFAVERTELGACVAVAHGTARVTRGTTVSLVTDRRQLCSGDADPHVIPPGVADQLARHEQSLRIAEPANVPPPAENRTDDVAQTAQQIGRTSERVATAPTTDAPRTATGASAPRAPRTAPATSPTTSAPPIATANDASRAVSADGPRVATGSAPAPTTATATAAAPVPTNAMSANAARTTGEAAPAPTAEELYGAAERGLARGDRAGADRALAQVVALGGALVDQALYERARIAYQGRSWMSARAQLGKLAAIASTPLAEPGRYLDCRIAVESKAADAERCFTDYRTAYPRSPHDLDVLAVLAQLAYARGGCSAAKPLSAELIARYPRTDHAAAWRSRCPESP